MIVVLCLGPEAELSPRGKVKVESLELKETARG